MKTSPQGKKPTAQGKTLEALALFEQFYFRYCYDLQAGLEHLEHMTQSVNPAYAAGYRPWVRSLSDFLQGMHSVMMQTTPQHPSRFIDSMRTFRLESSVNFLKDVCICRNVHISNDWGSSFKTHLEKLLEVYPFLEISLQQFSDR